MLQYRCLKRKIEESGGIGPPLTKTERTDEDSSPPVQREPPTQQVYNLPTVNEIILPKTGEQSPQDVNMTGKVYFLQEVQNKLPKSLPAINSARRDSVFTKDDLSAFSNQLPTKAPISRGSICIPKNQTNKPTLVLDLDETLVHSSLTVPSEYDHVLHIYIGGNLVDIFVKYRPYLFPFLREIAQLYEVIVFTSSVEIYADRLLDVIDPFNQFFQVFRDSCIQYGRHFIKDLDLLQRDPAKTIIVDDSPKSYAYHKSNGLQIKGYFGDDPNDDELSKFIPLLRHLSTVEDVRIELGTD